MPLGAVERKDGTRTRRAAGVGEDTVDPTEIGQKLFIARDDRVLGSHIDLVRADVTVAERGEFCRGARVLFFVSRPNRDVTALFGDAARKPEPDAAVPAGDQGNLAAQVKQLVHNNRPVRISPIKLFLA